MKYGWVGKAITRWIILKSMITFAIFPSIRPVKKIKHRYDSIGGCKVTYDILATFRCIVSWSNITQVLYCNIKRIKRHILQFN